MAKARKANGRTEKELADFISDHLKIPIRTGRDFLQKLLELICEDIHKGGRSELRGLGSFQVYDRPGRKAKHPKDGTPVVVPDRKAVGFRASKALKELINKPAPKPKAPRRRAKASE